MKINIGDCNKNMSIYDFVLENTQTGNASLKLYGDEADNWINATGKVPYIIIDGKMQWNISIKKATVFDLVKTFQLNIGNNLEIDIEEVQNWGRFAGNIELQNTILKKYLQTAIKQWEPREKNLRVEKLIKYIKYAGVNLNFVFDAIWIRDYYSLEDFMDLFSVSKKNADIILRCAGYEKKKCNSSYCLMSQRQNSILECIEKTFEVSSTKENELSFYGRYKRKKFRVIENLGERIAEYGRVKNYSYINNIFWSEPVYHKREDKLDIILSFLSVICMLGFVILIVGVFSHQMSINNLLSVDSIYSFWGSIAGSMIAGLVTIFTTYLIIQRSYKIDFHQERIAVLPFFEIDVVANHFSTDLDSIPEEIRKIMESHICYSTCIMEDAMLVEIKNVGAGPAFQVKVEGLTVDYEEPLFQSITVDNKKYMICYSRNDFNIVLKFSDMYSNYYYQKFYSEMNQEWNDSYIEVNANPPEIVLRTKRTRYVQ